MKTYISFSIQPVKQIEKGGACRYYCGKLPVSQETLYSLVNKEYTFNGTRKVLVYCTQTPITKKEKVFEILKDVLMANDQYVKEENIERDLTNKIIQAELTKLGHSNLERKEPVELDVDLGSLSLLVESQAA